jgi:hypothetical protein
MIIKEEIDHYNMALWLLHKMFIQKGMALSDLSMRNTHGLLTKLKLFMEADNPEMTLLSLRTLLAYL